MSEIYTVLGSLERWGLRWKGSDQPVCELMEDGYWTPWHKAKKEIDRLKEENRKLRTVIENAIKCASRCEEEWDDKVVVDSFNFIYQLHLIKGELRRARYTGANSPQLEHPDQEETE